MTNRSVPKKGNRSDKGNDQPRVSIHPDAAAISALLDQLYEKGRWMLEQSRVLEAISPWQEIVSMIPQNATAHYNLGGLFMRAGDTGRAIDCYQQAVELNPDYAPAWCNLGAALQRSGNHNEAISAFIKAIHIIPQYALAHANLAECYEMTNRLDEAKAAVRKSLAIEPEQPVAQLVLARIYIRFHRWNEARMILERLLAKEMTLRQRAHAHNLYGRVLEKLQDPQKAYLAFTEAQRLHCLSQEVCNIDPMAYPAMLEHIHTWWQQQCSARERKPSSISKVQRAEISQHTSPVFLVGFPRSGTTLAEHILSAHPALVSSNERPLLDAVVNALRPKNKPELAWTAALKEPHRVDWKAMRSLYWQQAARLSGYRTTITRFVDKLPLNIVHLGLVEILFPDSQVLVVLRDPRDACLSAFQQEFVPNEAMVQLTSIQSAAKLYEKVMGLWLIQRSRLSLPWLEIRYEDLVKNPNEIVRQMLAFLKLPIDPAVFRFYESSNTRHISTPSYHSVVRPIHTDSIGRWKPYESFFEESKNRLASFINAFGYEQQ